MSNDFPYYNGNIEKTLKYQAFYSLVLSMPRYIVGKVKEAKTLVDLIYTLEPLCYYFNMKPNEFWNSTYGEINSYTQSNLSYSMDNFRQEIRLQEAVTNKLIMADTMSNKRPKIIPLQKTFESLFPEKEEKQQFPEKIIRKMRKIMNKSK